MQMDGVGRVDVMITVSDGGEQIVEKDKKTTSSSTGERDSGGGERSVTEQAGKIRRYTWRLQMKNIRMYRKRRCRRWQALWWSQREAGTRRRFLRFQSPCRHY